MHQESCLRKLLNVPSSDHVFPPFKEGREITHILGTVAEIIIFLFEQEICQWSIDFVKLEHQLKFILSVHINNQYFIKKLKVILKTIFKILKLYVYE